MRVLQTCTLLVGTAAATTLTAADISTQFTAWQRRFDGVPGSLAAFAANVKLIEAHNARHDRGETSFRMGINQFAALTAAEFKDLVSRPVPVMDRHALGDVVPLSQTDVPAAVDWVAKGAVTPVKDQGSCGSCWAFSATGAVEGAYQIATGALRSLSEQQVIDCFQDCAQHACGCEGGYPSAAFKYVLANGGLDTDDDYNYTQISIPCDAIQAKRVAAKIDSFNMVPPMNETQLLLAVTQQPVSVGVNAYGPFQFYSSGVLDASVNASCTCNDVSCLDHAVLITGFGTDSSIDYWAVKNSWGAAYGEAGYIRMARHVNDAYGENTGLCGIAVLPSIPVVAKGPALPLPPLTPPHPSPRPADWCGNCGENCEYQCRTQIPGYKCDDQTTVAPVTCNCQNASEPCHSGPTVSLPQHV